MADALPQILIPEGHEPPKPPQPRDASVWLWRLAVVVLVVLAVIAAVLLDRASTREPPLPQSLTPPSPASDTTP